MSDIIESIADALVDDHVELIAENKRLRIVAEMAVKFGCDYIPETKFTKDFYDALRAAGYLGAGDE